jgi:hypothetical protein
VSSGSGGVSLVEHPNPGNVAELIAPYSVRNGAAAVAAGAEIYLDPTSNADDNMYDGIDWGARWMAEEVGDHSLWLHASDAMS